MKARLFLLVIFVIFFKNLYSQGTWQWVADHPDGNRSGSTAFTIDSMAYIAAGSNDVGLLMNDLWEWNKSTGSWTQKASFGSSGRYGASSFSIGAKGYVTCGFDGGYENDLWEWDKATNTWSQKSSMPATPREYAVSFSINTKGYVSTGESNAGDLKDFWEWDQSTDTWTQQADFPGTARMGAVGFSIATKGYIGTGIDPATHSDNDFWEWDQVTATWSQKASFLGISRQHAVGFVIGSRGYIATGLINSTSGNLNDLWEWDAINNNWTQLADFIGVARDNAVGFAIDTVGYVGTGHNNSSGYSYKNFYKWWGQSPSSPWHIRDTIHGPVRESAFSFAINGKGYLGGGDNYSNGTFSDFWEFDPATNAWTQKADLIQRVTGAASFVISNLGYVCTGFIDHSGSIFKNLWAYDPVLNVWTTKADLSGWPRYFAIGFSIGNKGYVSMGIDSTGSQNCLTDLWEYDAVTDSWSQKTSFPGTPRSSSTCFVIGTKVYVATGRTCPAGFLGDVWEWDQTTDTWTQKQNFPGAVRQSPVSFTIAGRGFMGTGWNGGASGFKNDFWRYDPTLDSWTQIERFAGIERSDATAFSIGNKGYVGTGVHITTYYSDFWVYNDSANIATATSEQPGKQNEIVIYPNPTTGLFHCHIDLKKYSLIIYSADSKIIKALPSLSAPDLTIDLNNYPEGIYFIRAFNEEDVIVRRIVVTR